MRKLLIFSAVGLLISGVCLADGSVEDQEATLESHYEHQAKQQQAQDLYEFQMQDGRHRAAKASLLYEMALASNTEDSGKEQKSYHQAKELYEQAAEGAHQRRRHLDQLRMLKLLQLLDLREDQEVEFMHTFRSLSRELRDIQEERKETIERLASDLTEGKHTPGSVARAIDELRSLDDRRISAQDRFLANAKQVLSPKQLGKLVIFQERFEREMLSNLREFQFRRQEGAGAQGRYRGLHNEMNEDIKGERRSKPRR